MSVSRPDLRIAALAGLAGMVRDARLAQLRTAAATRAAAAQTRDALPLAPDLAEEADAGLGFVALRARWLDQARVQANARLAAALAVEMDAHAAAARATGRADVLRRLADRPPRG